MIRISVGIEDIEDLKEDFKRVIEGDDENGKVDYATLKKGGFMRQKQKNIFHSDLPALVELLRQRTSKRLRKLQKNTEMDMFI